MGRLILLIIIGCCIYGLWVYLQNLKKRAQQPPTEDAEPMVKCIYCGVYAPQSKSIQANDGQWYCSKDHEQKARR